MINILNGYQFKRNLTNNDIVYPVSQLACILGLQPHEIKEHYFYCVVDDCLAQGELHTEEVCNGELEIYLPVFNIKTLIESLKREGFKIDEFQSNNIVEKMLETQSIISECFELKNGFNSYKDPIRKHNPSFVKPINESISKNKE